MLTVLDGGVCLRVRLHSPNHVRSIQSTIRWDIYLEAALGLQTVSNLRLCLFHHRISLLTVITLNDEAVLEDYAGLGWQTLPVSPG